ncbi:Uncharacterised protein [Shigella sonnei]|nr:Uncharacterised protein [Shigella sonnei]CSS38293.1 Uncharacterised protein [Shigella sonnei]
MHIHQVTVFIQLKLSVTAVEHRTVAVYQTEKTVLADSNVQTSPGVGGRAIGKVLSDTGNFYPQSHFRTGKHIGKRGRA